MYLTESFWSLQSCFVLSQNKNSKPSQLFTNWTKIARTLIHTVDNGIQLLKNDSDNVFTILTTSLMKMIPRWEKIFYLHYKPLYAWLIILFFPNVIEIRSVCKSTTTLNISILPRYRVNEIWKWSKFSPQPFCSRFETWLAW